MHHYHHVTNQIRPQTRRNIKRNKSKKVYVYKKPELKLRIDTLNVSDDNFKKIATQGAAGVFFSAMGRARVAAINEIMAPASEIIEVDIISIQ